MAVPETVPPRPSSTPAVAPARFSPFGHDTLRLPTDCPPAAPQDQPRLDPASPPPEPPRRTPDGFTIPRHDILPLPRDWPRPPPPAPQVIRFAELPWLTRMILRLRLRLGPPIHLVDWLEPSQTRCRLPVARIWVDLPVNCADCRAGRPHRDR